ncbi:hypothetical protein [Anaerophaga thermohalophila]|uniref:hypothetical protein n=1 Tax=Anaerophaga thermohalophila TaxID=177400 RepID=UPI00159EE07F|nr:hypothetical protein [Anaerophaga thermohalophila]
MVDKFGRTKNVIEIEDSNFISINTTFLEKTLTEKNSNLLLQIPSSYQNTELLFANLLLRLTELQFLEADTDPEYEVGMTLKAMQFNKRRDFELIQIFDNNDYRLREIIKGKKKANYSPAVISTTYEKLKSKYVLITGGTRKKRLEGIRTIFNQLYGVDFIPSKFKSKSIVVCKKSIWNGIASIEILESKLKDLIPSTYITKKGTEQPTINIDSALYFVPDYSTAYQCVLCKGEKIDNILLLDPKPNQLPTMIMDQSEHHFGICAITTQNFEVEGFSTWRWLKEEIDLINSL